MAKDYYSSIADSYDKLYGDEQKAKFGVIRRHVKLKPLVLDIGCGSGVVDFGATTIGIDPSFGLLKKNRNLKVCARAESLPFKDHVFGSVVSLTALHHADVGKTIKEIKRVAKPDAVLAFSILKKARDFKAIVKKLKLSFDLEEIDHEKDLILVKH